MTTASNTAPARTNNPTRSSVHVNCLCCAIGTPPHRIPYSVLQVTTKSDANTRRGYPLVQAGPPQKGLPLRKPAQNLSPPRGAVILHCAQRARLGQTGRQNGSLQG